LRTCKHGLGRAVIFWKGTEQFAAERGRVGQAAIGEQHVDLRPPNRVAGGVEYHRAVERLGRRREIAEPI
jgi:hypothetical protein